MSNGKLVHRFAGAGTPFPLCSRTRRAVPHRAAASPGVSDEQRAPVARRSLLVPRPSSEAPPISAGLRRVSRYFGLPLMSFDH